MSRFLKNAAAYTGTNMVGQLFKIGQEFILRRLLSPEYLGVWNLATVVVGFANTFDLGIASAAERELPLLEGAGQKEEAQRVRSTAFWSKFAQGVVAALGIMLYAVLFRRSDSAIILAGFGVGAFLVLLYAFIDTAMIFHQVSQKYVSLSRVLLISSIASSMLLPVGAFLGGAWGLLAGGVAGVALQAILLTTSARLQGVSFGKLWDALVLRRLVAFGLPLRLTDYPLSLFPVVDGMFVARFLGLESLAIYATAKIVLTQAADIPARIGNVLIMRIFNQAGASRSRADLAGDLMRFLTITHLILIPLILLAVNSVVSFLFVQFLPKYTSSLPLLHTLLFAMFFMPNSSIVRNFWILDQRLLTSGLANAVGFLGLLVAGWSLTALHGRSLQAVASSMVLGYGWFFLCLMASIGLELWGWRKTLQLCASIGVAVAYTCLALRTLSPQIERATLAAGLAVLVLNLGKSLVLLTPLGLFAAWRARLFQYLRFAMG